MSVPKVLFLVGSDRFQQKLKIDEIRSKMFPGGSGGLNDDSFDVRDRTASDLFDLCNTMPMFARHRFVLVRGLEKLPEKDQDPWCAYLSNPSPSTALIATAEKLDKRTRLFKAAERAGMVLETAEPRPREMPGWVTRMAAYWGVKPDAAAEESLLEAVGVSLPLLQQQLEKLALYVHPRKEISGKDVHEMVFQASGETVFAWTDQVMEGKSADALNTLGYLLESGDPPLVLVSLLARHIRILLRAHDLLRRKAHASEYATALKVPPFAVGRYLDQARKVPSRRLFASMKELARLDRELKSTGLPPQFLLERLVRTITAPRLA